MSDQPEIAPCLFCGGPCARGAYYVYCEAAACGYHGGDSNTAAEAIAAHNELANRVPVERLREVLQVYARPSESWRTRFDANAVARELGIRLEESDEQ